MPDCAACNRPLGKHRLRCHVCGACGDCCECEVSTFTPFDPDELGLDPELDADFWKERH